MGLMVVQGAALQCSFGMSPGNLCGTGNMTCLAEGKPMAAVQDVAAGSQIAPFGMCQSPANPQVAAATAAALGVLTPQPCMPIPLGTWVPTKAEILIGGVPCLLQDSKLICSNGMGIITVCSPGQFKVNG